MKTILRAFLALLLFGLAVGCTTSIGNPAATAVAKADSRAVYNPKNDLEFTNYNDRQKIADDPTTILWCTTAFPIPSSPLITVPIKGKLTSGNKRPYATSRVITGSSYDYSPEVPGPDGMYGASGEYRYGFSPNNVYQDFYNLPTYCTTEPTIWQRQATTIVAASDPDLLAAQQAAQAALKAGDAKKADQILQDAIHKVQR